MLATEQDLEAFVRIRTGGASSALDAFLDYKQKISDSVLVATRQNCLRDLMYTRDYRDAPCVSEQWIIDCRKKRAKNAILYGRIE